MPAPLAPASRTGAPLTLAIDSRRVALTLPGNARIVSSAAASCGGGRLWDPALDGLFPATPNVASPARIAMPVEAAGAASGPSAVRTGPRPT